MGLWQSGLESKKLMLKVMYRVKFTERDKAPDIGIGLPSRFGINIC